MPTEINQLPEQRLIYQSSGTDYSGDRWLDEDICSRIRSLLLSRNYNFPPRTPFSSDENLNTYSKSHITKLQTSTYSSSLHSNTVPDTQRDIVNWIPRKTRKTLQTVLRHTENKRLNRQSLPDSRSFISVLGQIPGQDNLKQPKKRIVRSSDGVDKLCQGLSRKIETEGKLYGDRKSFSVNLASRNNSTWRFEIYKKRPLHKVGQYLKTNPKTLNKQPPRPLEEFESFTSFSFHEDLLRQSAIMNTSSCSKSELMDTFPHAVQSSNMASNKIQDPSYSTTVTTNFSLAGIKDQNKISNTQDSKPYKQDLNQSVYSDLSNDENRQGKFDTSLRLKPKSPSLRSATSKKSARHSLLKPSQKDNRPTDVGLALAPMVSPFSDSHNSNQIGITDVDITRDSIHGNDHAIESGIDIAKVSQPFSSLITKSPVGSITSLPLLRVKSPKFDSEQELSKKYPKTAESLISRDTSFQPTAKLFDMTHREFTSADKSSAHKIDPNKIGNPSQNDLPEADGRKITDSYRKNANGSLRLSMENSDRHLGRASHWSQTPQSLQSEPESISKRIPPNHKVSWWEESPYRRSTTGDHIFLAQNSASRDSKDRENEFFENNQGNFRNGLRPKMINGTNNTKIYTDRKTIRPEAFKTVTMPFYELSPPEFKEQDYKRKWNDAVPDGYVAVQAQDIYNVHAPSTTSVSPNSLHVKHFRSKGSRNKNSNQMGPEIHLESSAGSFKSLDSTSKDHNIKSSQPSGLHETDNSEPSIGNTVAWLKKMLPSSSPLQNSLSSLTGRVRYRKDPRKLDQSNIVSAESGDISPLRKLPNLLESRKNKLQSEKLKSRHHNSSGTDVSETLADTINDLEILMKEAILLAQQAGQCHNSTHIPFDTGTVTKVLNDGQAGAPQSTDKMSNIDGENQSLLNHSEMNKTHRGEVTPAFSAMVRDKVPNCEVKDEVSRLKSESGRRLAERSPTLHPSATHRSSEVDSEKLRLKASELEFKQSSDDIPNNELEKNSNKSDATVFRNDDISHTNSLELLRLQSLGRKSAYLKRKSSSISPQMSQSLRSRKVSNHDITANKLQEINMAPFSQISRDLNQGQNYFKQDLGEEFNHKYVAAQIPKKNSFLANYSRDESETTCSEVINFSAGFGVNYHGRGEASKIRSPRDKQISDKTDIHLSRLNRSGHKYDFDLSGKSHISLKDHHFNEFSLKKGHKGQTIARDWSPARKRFVATVSCISTSLIGIIAGIYSGEAPSIQYYIADFHHYTVLGNIFFFIGLAITTFFAWPLPLLHGRKPYILGAMSIAMPLLFPQALAVGEFRSPYESIWRIGLLLPRTLMGFCLGFANMNFKSMLTDLFGASLQSSNPHQEHADEFDVRRHGGGMGIWLGLWTWSTLGSIGLGFFIGAAIVEKLPPSWGFYVSIIIIAFVMFLNVVCPEVRRSTYRKSVAEVVTEGAVSRRLARGEVKMHMVKSGPRWWGEELHYGIKLSQKMVRQTGFLIMSLYVAWIYGQQVLLILLLGALMSKDYNLRSPLVGVCVMAIAFGALIAIPFQKASLFSRSNRGPPVDDDGTLSKKKLHWSSHMLRRTIFVLFLPCFGILITLIASGPPIPFILPPLVTGVIGFLSSLAMAECLGIIMETFDTSDLEPGMTGHPRGISDSQKGVKRKNYSSFPRVCSAFAITETFGYIFAAGASGIGGVLTRHLGQQAAIGVMTGILFILSILLLGILVRFTEVQIIPDSKMDEMNRYQARRASYSQLATDQNDDEEAWRPIIIGNPHQSTRRMCLLELGSLSRFSEIRRRNRLIDEMSIEARHPNRNAMNSLERRIKDKEVEIINNLRKSFSRSSRGSGKKEVLSKGDASGSRGTLIGENESHGAPDSISHKRIFRRGSKILE